MCGICGEWNGAGVAEHALQRMNDAMRHRGPDDEGHELRGEAALAMRRLSIIDVAGGHQPIANEDGTAWIVFNGAIYNFRELRDGLQARGHEFSTASDTEVILHLYEEEGANCVEKLRGMFAFAIWDERRRRLFMARDRFGQKPLFYSFDGKRFVFGSEIKAVLAGLESTPALDLGSLDDYLSLRFVPSPGTMFAGISKLPPGHSLLLDAARVAPPGHSGADGSTPSIEVRRYWQLDYLPKLQMSEEEAVKQVRTRVLEAVESHLVADVPVGAFLSGGMDSSLVVAAMAQAGEPPPTFAIGVAEQDFNELPYARQVAEYCHTDHREEVVWPDLVKLLPTMVYHLDEPSDPIAACMYHAAALAAKHVKVVITGDGGDELFAGFDRYFGFRWVGLYAALPAPVRRVMLGPLLGALPDGGGYKNLTQKLRWLHELSFHQGGRRYAEATLFFRFGEGGKGGLYAAEVAARLTDRDPTRCIVEAFEGAEAVDDLDRMLYADVVTRLPEHSLMLSDRMTMAHGLEARSPFLDHLLAEYVATLPAGLKAKGRHLKYLMRRVSEGLLPREILDRPKQGFMFPLAYWMKGPLVPVLEDLLTHSAVVEAGIFQQAAIRRLLEEHIAGKSDHHVRLWMILNVEIWYRLYLQGESVDSIGERLQKLVAPANGAR